jgi:hypothetical protein
MSTIVIRVYPADAARLEAIRGELVRTDGRNRHLADALEWLFAAWDGATLIACSAADVAPAPQIGTARLAALCAPTLTLDDFNRLATAQRQALATSYANAGFLVGTGSPEPPA